MLTEAWTNPDMPQRSEQPSAPPEESSQSKQQGLRNWFIAHSILLTILNVPAIVLVSINSQQIISVALLAYNVLLLAAAVWNHRPCQQAVYILSIIFMCFLAIALVILPSIAVAERPYSRDPSIGIAISFLLVLVLALFAAQLLIVHKIFTSTKNRDAIEMKSFDRTCFSA